MDETINYSLGDPPMAYKMTNQKKEPDLLVILWPDVIDGVAVEELERQILDETSDGWNW